MSVYLVIFLELCILLPLTWLAGEVFRLMGAPKLLGYLLFGILVGNLMLLFNVHLWMQDHVKSIASLCLSVILLKAGLGISTKTLKKVGVRAGYLGIIPNLVEGSLIMLLGYFWLPLTAFEAGMLGFAVSAVSPAVVIPSMSKIKHEGYGVESGMPTMNLASSSIDDVVSLTMFTVFASLATTDSFSAFTIIKEPIMLLNGILFGLLFGYIYVRFYVSNNKKIQQGLQFVILAAPLIVILFFRKDIYINYTMAIIVAGFAVANFSKKSTEWLLFFTNKIWYIAQIILFYTIGSIVRVSR